MVVWEHKIPAYLLQKKNIISLILFTAVFALAFINFYAPFHIDFWYSPTKIQLFAYSSLVILTGVLVIVVSRFTMYRINKNFPINYLIFAFILLFEILSMATFYSLIGKYMLNDDRVFIALLIPSVKNTSLVLLIPYTLSWLFFAWRDKSEQLKELSQKEKTDEEESSVLNKMVAFYDEKGTLRLSLIFEDLLFLEASDNYVSINYDANGKITKYMIRNTLKKLEDYLSSYPVIRCHRSFLVNFKKVRILKREKEGLYIELNSEKEIQLPVSKTYVKPILELFSEESA